jgi:thymidylate synthase (FAD)
MKLINDPYFDVQIDKNGSSPAPLKAIWNGQHACVTEGFSLDDEPPIDLGSAIINNQLKVKHWSVLDYGFVILHFKGFPHDTVMQLVRHQDSKPLVQSMRYTGERMIEASNDKTLIPSLFYAQPEGIYYTRTGKYEVTKIQRLEYFEDCWKSTIRYANLINQGLPEEAARRYLLAGSRQNFTMAGTVRAVFHWLDQRTLADSQIESQTLAKMSLNVLCKWCPELFNYYVETRSGKNLLAP